MSWRVDRSRLGPYDLVDLRDEAAGSLVSVAPERGGMAVQFAVAGREVLYLDADTFVDPSRSVRGGIPILFPIAGPVHGDTYEARGRSWRMKQHGLARSRPWRLLEARDSDGDARATVELESDDETRAAYPWDFRVRFTYVLKGGHLSILQEYENRSDSPMPVHLGLHPYFAAPDKEALEFHIPATRFDDTEHGVEGLFSGRFDFTQEVLDLAFLDVARPTATLADPGRGLQVRLDFAAPYRYLVFWTLKDKPFVCLEPWSARRFAMNTGEGLVSIAPGETLHTEVALLATVS